MPLEIDIVSDVICPWCLIGTKRLDDALATRPGLDAKLAFRPFQLDPTTPASGVDLRESLRRKYGDPEPMFRRVEAAARESGIALDFAKVHRSPNTLAAHVLIDRAAARGTQHDVVKALFAAHFLEGRDVGDPDVLASIGAAHGFSADEARALVTDDAERARVRSEAQELSQQGVSGVPFFIFAGKYAVSGAQPVAVFQQVLDRVTKEQA